MSTGKHGDPTRFPPPGESHLTHQGDRWLHGLAPLCRRCALRERCPRYDPADADRQCPEAREAQEAIFTQVMALPHVTPQDAYLAEELSISVVWLQIIDRYCAEVGSLVVDRKRGTLDVQPVLRNRWTVANAVQRLSDRLGIGPVARAKLKAVSGAVVSPFTAAVLALESGEVEPDGDNGE